MQLRQLSLTQQDPADEAAPVEMAPDVDTVMGATHLAQVVGDAVYLPMITIKLDDRACLLHRWCKSPTLKSSWMQSACWHSFSAARKRYGLGCWASASGPGDLHYRTEWSVCLIQSCSEGFSAIPGAR